jgi:hypothetical protein
LVLASRIPLSSKVSRTAAIRYTSLSWWREASSGAGGSPSWKGDMLPPGKTCAEAKDDEVFTLRSSRMWFCGEINNTLGELSVN